MTLGPKVHFSGRKCVSCWVEERQQSDQTPFTFKFCTFHLPGFNEFKSHFHKANGSVCFASSQVWSEHRMETTSWDPFLGASPREKTSRHPLVTSHTSSTRVKGTTRQSRGVISLRVLKRDPQIQLRTPSRRDPQSPRPNRSTTRPREVSTKGGKHSKMCITVLTVAPKWSIIGRAITKTTTTDAARSRGSTSAGEGRNVCKGNFSFYSTCRKLHARLNHLINETCLPLFSMWILVGRGFSLTCMNECSHS